MTSVETRSLAGNEIRWLREGPGCHGTDQLPVAEVEESLKGAFRFREEGEEEAGLRPPQLGALHAILAHRSMESNEPITIVMPTGTGKTDTMVAAFCQRPSRTLIVVPSDALREQVTQKFLTLGVLPAVGAVEGGFRCPSVGVMRTTLADESQVDEFALAANVIVTTAQALGGSDHRARKRLARLCSRLFVDEAHHGAARTWRQSVELFEGKEVVQFTATPFREDGKHLGGSVAYAYPLRLAQRNGYFARINYRSVTDLAEPDRAVAAQAIQQLRQDLDAGLDHLLMARVRSVERAREVVRLYEELAPDLNPGRIDTGVAESVRAARRRALLERKSRIVVCVNMLGEGFDLPALKVAAIHDPQRSLAVTLQFVGRFTRAAGADLGDASAFVPVQVAGVDERLRRLYGEDADWNEVIVDITEREVGGEKERSDFESGFESVPAEVAMRSIHPKMSTVTFASQGTLEWQPDRIYDLFADRLLTTTLGVNHEHKVVWWVSREATPVRWGEFASFNELVHHLHVVHVDEEHGFLYINSSNNASLHEDIAKAVGGEDVRLLAGESVYRVLHGIQRRVPTNVGLLDAVSRTRRFSMHVGQDVLAAWSGEGGTKMKTNIFAHGYAGRQIVSYGASRKGRVWSHQEARDIHDWVKWARQIGPIITDSSISLAEVMSGFLLPEPVTARPPLVPLSIEWPHHLMLTLSDSRQITYQGQSYPLLEAELRLTSHTASGPLRFEAATPEWSLEFEFAFSADGGPPAVTPVGEDGVASTTHGDQPLSSFLSDHGLYVIFEDDAILVEQGLLLRPDRERRLFPTDQIEVADWNGIDITRESQGPTRDPGTVQYRTAELLMAESQWDVAVDDDGPGELADLVFLRRDGERLEVLLAHCKYSSGAVGSRVNDFYDVCGQAMKMHRAKSLSELLTRRLLRREQRRQASGATGILSGDIDSLVAITQNARFLELRTTVAIVQPGLSRTAASEDVRTLLGATERFLQETFEVPLRVIASA